jgi:hypothetical protein
MRKAFRSAATLALMFHCSSQARAAEPEAAPSLPAAKPAPIAPGPADAPPAPSSAEAPPAPSAPAATAETEGPRSSESAAIEAEAATSVETSSGSGLFEQSSEAGPAEGASAPASASGVDLGATVRGDVFVGKVQDRRRAEMKAAYGELGLKVRAKKERMGDAYAEARFRYGLQGEAKELFVDLREAYVNLYAGPLDLRLGQQIIVWGRADALNPTNNLTPFDLRVRSPVEDDRRLGNVGARAFLNFAPMRLEGVWMPIYAASELPVVVPAYVTMAESRFPRPTIENGLVAGRLHLELAEFEASVSYLYGHAPLPGLALSGFTAGVASPEVRVARAAYDQHVVGLDFSTAIGDALGIRGEAAFRRPLHYQDRPHAARPDLQYILGVDHNFGSVSLIAQYGGRVVFDWHREDGPAEPLDPSMLANLPPPLPPLVVERVNASINQELAKRNQMLFSQRRKVQHFASARLEWMTAHDTLSLSALGFVNFSTREWLLFPKVGYHISDALSTTVGAEIYAGPDDTLFGLVDQQLSAGYAELRCDF